MVPTKVFQTVMHKCLSRKYEQVCQNSANKSAPKWYAQKYPKVA